MVETLIMVALVGTLVIVAYSLGLSAGHRMSRWKDPLPTPREAASVVIGERKDEKTPDKTEDGDDAIMWQMFAAAGPKPEPPKD